MTYTLSGTLDRPVFVVGHPRSGTTLLASMLGRHASIVSTPETLYMNMVRFRVRAVLHLGPDAVLNAILTSPMRFLVLDEADVLTALGALPVLTLRNVFETVLSCFQIADGKPRLLEKTPVHLRHVDELLEWFPDAQVVWIVRDGRACIASLTKVNWATNDLVTLAQQWRRNMAFGKMFAGAHADRIHILRYEELVTDPQETLAPTLRFLDLDPDSAIFDHTQAVHTVKPTETSWKQNVMQPLMPSRADAWKDSFSEQDLYRVEAIIGPSLRQFGYAPLTQAKPVRAAIERTKSIALQNPAGLRLMRSGFLAKESLKANVRQSVSQLRRKTRDSDHRKGGQVA
ncbi:sulfotransferase family protein [uncultured Tateyamaria sp.]|nr:sulfotransferase [uncultured Tateyamaria sp.]